MAARTSQLLAHLAPPAPSDAQLLAANATVQDQARQRVGVIMGAELLKFLHENHSGLLMHIDPVVVDFKGNLADPAQAETMRRALVYVRTEGTNAQVSERILDKAPNVLWFHSPSAGVDFLLKSKTIAARVRVPPTHPTADSIAKTGGFCLTNNPGATAVPISEFVLMYMLFWAKKVHELRTAPLPAATGNPDDANGKNWWRKANQGLVNKIQELHGSTVLIWGFGGIGQNVGRRCRAFGMKVIGTRRNLAPEGIIDGSYDTLVGEDRWKDYLGQADYFVICAPLTATTRGTVDRNLLSRLKKGAFLINIARGGIINDSDLCDAINSGQLSGCALDVFEPEPLPASSPLLKLPQDKVFYTPHISWAGSQADIKDEFSAENLWNFVNGAELKAVIRDITL